MKKFTTIILFLTLLYGCKKEDNATIPLLPSLEPIHYSCTTISSGFFDTIHIYSYYKVMTCKAMGQNYTKQLYGVTTTSFQYRWEQNNKIYKGNGQRTGSTLVISLGEYLWSDTTVNTMPYNLVYKQYAP